MNQYDHLKKNLRDYKVEVDKEKLWKNTSHAIPQKRKKRAALFFLTSAIVLSAVSYTYFESIAVKPEHAVVQQTESDDKTTIPTNELLEIIPAASPVKTSASTLTNHNSTFGNKNDIAAAKRSASNEVRVKTHREINSDNDIHSLENFDAAVPTEWRATSQDPETTMVVSGKIAENNLLSVSTKTEYTESLTIHVNDGHRGIAHNLHEDESAEGHKDALRHNPSLEAVAFLAINLEGLPVEARTGVTGSHNPRVEPAEVHHLSSIQVIQGIGLTTMSIQSLDPESNELATQLSKTHESLETFSTTVSGNVKLPLGFSVDAGIQYNQLNTKMQHAWTTTERYTREGISQIIIDQHGLQESVTGNVGVTKFTHIQSTRFTSHKNIDLVASLRKIMWNYRRSSLDVFMKGGYNLSYRAEGSLLNKDGSVEKFSPSDNPYSRASPFVYCAGLQFQYRISSRLYVHTSMDYQRINYLYQPKDQQVQFRFATFNAAIGIGYSL